MRALLLLRSAQLSSQNQSAAVPLKAELVMYLQGLAPGTAPQTVAVVQPASAPRILLGDYLPAQHRECPH